MAARQGMTFVLLAGLAGGAGLAAQEGGRRVAEATSLLGRPLYAPEIPAERLVQLEAQLGEARAAWAKSPDDVEAVIWVGRRAAYLGRYREAITIFSDGLERFPGNAKLLRHRGHRYLTVREIDKAILDFEAAVRATQGTADEVEADGAPNAQNIPRSTLQTNIWYHLGLARYLKGEFGKSAEAFGECLKLSKNDDMAVAARYWLYLGLMRAGRKAEAGRVLAGVQEKMDVMENDAYHGLLLLFKGERGVAAVLGGANAAEISGPTTAYGVGAWHLVNGRDAEARAEFEKIVAGMQWAAFGFLAAEAEVARGK